MIYSNRSIHADTLRPSCAVLEDLAAAIERNYLKLCPMWLARKGEELVFPKSLDQDVLRWRQLRTRYKRGDYRHTPAEIKSCQAVADWTLEVKAELDGKQKLTIHRGEL